MFYRAVGDDGISHIGLAITDGFKVLERLPDPIFSPQIPEEIKGVKIHASLLLKIAFSCSTLPTTKYCTDSSRLYLGRGLYHRKLYQLETGRISFQKHLG